MGNLSQSYGTSPAICDHTHSVTCHPTQVNAASKLVLDNDLGGMEG